MKAMAISIVALCNVLSVLAQSGLISGPMLGHTDMREANIWLQASTKSVQVHWQFEGQELWNTAEFPVVNSIAKCRISDLEPATTYNYFLVISGEKSPVYNFRTQALWQYRTDPPAFRVAAGSCTFINEPKYDRPGEPYGGDYYIFDTIASKKPDLMLWLGDNVYFREVDFNSYSSMQNRYNELRRLKDLKRLLSVCPHYALWDDHDFGPNDGTGCYIHKDWTLNLFQQYWSNPSYGIPGLPGITTSFSHSDIDFFLLDNRYQKVDPEVLGQNPVIFGKTQLDWLIQNLKYSKAPFKIVATGGQILNSVNKFETLSTVPSERAYLLDAIEKNSITGVIFLSGDRHCAEMSTLTLAGGIQVFEVTTSPLTSKAYDLSKEENKHRIAGSVIAERNFATIDFSGPRKARKAVIIFWDNKGREKWKYTVEQSK
jgi:alkaline phosphatase D